MHTHKLQMNRLGKAIKRICAEQKELQPVLLVQDLSQITTGKLFTNTKKRGFKKPLFFTNFLQFQPHHPSQIVSQILP